MQRKACHPKAMSLGDLMYQVPNIWHRIILGHAYVHCITIYKGSIYGSVHLRLCTYIYMVVQCVHRARWHRTSAQCRDSKWVPTWLLAIPRFQSSVNLVNPHVQACWCCVKCNLNISTNPQLPKSNKSRSNVRAGCFCVIIVFFDIWIIGLLDFGEFGWWRYTRYNGDPA